MNSKLTYIKNWSELAAEAKWSASAIAKKCNVSVRTLERYFLKQMGKSPKSWLFEQRQNLASQLLCHGNRVKEIATHLGYNHATQFSHDFKRYWGYSPTSQPLHRLGKRKML